MIRSDACWFPGLFLVNDFTVPGGAINKGDGKNPATHRTIRAPLLYQTPSCKHLRVPASRPPSARDSEREQQNPFPRFIYSDDAAARIVSYRRSKRAGVFSGRA